MLYYFLGPRPPYEHMRELASVALTGHFEGIPIVYAFTTIEAAENLLSHWPASSPYEPLTVKGRSLTLLLLELQANGYKTLGIDCTPTSSQLRTIADVLAEIDSSSS